MNAPFTATCHIPGRASGLGHVHDVLTEALHKTKNAWGQPIALEFPTRKALLDFIDHEGRHHEHAHTVYPHGHGERVAGKARVAA